MISEYLLLPIVSHSIIEYHGFRLWRHKSNEATCIEYKSAKGFQQIIAVKDAKFRINTQFGTYQKDVPELSNFTANGVKGRYIIDSNSLPATSSMPETYTNEAIYQNWGSVLASDKSAKENCDVWMQYNTYADARPYVVGVPAVSYCRSRVLENKSCNLGNLYQMICIFACGDKLDEMDPTLSNYSNMRLGYSSAYGARINFLLSSTEYNADYVRSVVYYGGTNNLYKTNTYTAVPILEI